MPTDTSTANSRAEYPDSPFSRDNYWGTVNQSDCEGDEAHDRGHSETRGTDAARYLAYQHLSEFTELLCKRSLEQHGREVPLSEPCLYVPKQVQGQVGVGSPPTECAVCGDPDLKRIAPRKYECTAEDCDATVDDDRTIRLIDYCQHRHRRRMNPETGWINWGESTGTTIPEEVDEELWMLAANNYLAERDVKHALAEDWLQYARRLYHDPNLNAQEALARLIRKKRAFDNPENNEVTEVPAERRAR